MTFSHLVKNFNFFSIFWGFGGVGFGQAIKRIGVALGTSVVMGIIVVIGTTLPAITSELSTTQAVGTTVGVLLGIAAEVGEAIVTATVPEDDLSGAAQTPCRPAAP